MTTERSGREGRRFESKVGVCGTELGSLVEVQTERCARVGEERWSGSGIDRAGTWVESGQKRVVVVDEAESP